ncbi:MAG: hypothetical protein GTO17_04745 [Candidatus Aminicenantes bacterium]|nr:hypothetical protein [Candidatus Aminicenantes bacterium]
MISNVRAFLVSFGALAALAVVILVTVGAAGRGGPKLPPPAYDSGWVVIDPTSTLTLNHNLGIHPDSLVVDLQFMASPILGEAGINNQFYGTGYTFAGFKGAYWSGLTENRIFVFREEDDLSAEKVRIRIWVHR